MAQKFGYNGKELSEELGLNTYDFGARNYSPDIARWSNIDALADATGQIHNTPYAYAMNNPTVFDDPDGNCPPGIDCTSILIGLATQNGNGVAAHTLGVAQGLTNTVTGVVDAVSNPGQTLQGMANMAVGGIANGNSATMLSLDSVLGTDSFGTSMAMGEAISNSADALVNGNGIERGTVIGEVIGAVLGTKGANAALKGASTVLKGVTKGTEVVQRAMSTAELNATVKTGLIRGGREGTHFVSNSVNSTAKGAQKRLALPTKPEVRATLRVSKGTFSKPTKVKPDYNQPGGGMERTATGKVPIEVIKVKKYNK